MKFRINVFYTINDKMQSSLFQEVTENIKKLRRQKCSNSVTMAKKLTFIKPFKSPPNRTTMTSHIKNTRAGYCMVGTQDVSRN